MNEPTNGYALGWDTVLFTVTIPGWLLALVLITTWLVLWVIFARWFDRRYLDPWLRRRGGLPPKNAPGCSEACSESHTYSWPCEALGEYGRAFAQELARNASSERLRGIASDLLAADPDAPDEECGQCGHPIRQHDDGGCMYPRWDKSGGTTCYCAECPEDFQDDDEDDLLASDACRQCGEEHPNELRHQTAPSGEGAA